MSKLLPVLNEPDRTEFRKVRVNAANRLTVENDFSDGSLIADFFNKKDDKGGVKLIFSLRKRKRKLFG